MLASIEKFPIGEVNEYGTKFIDWEDLPAANPHDFVVRGPRHQGTITGSWGYELYNPDRSMYTIATKQHFPSNIFVEDGAPFMTEIGCIKQKEFKTICSLCIPVGYKPIEVIYVRAEGGETKYCSSFGEALDWAARYLQARVLGIVVYNCLKYLP